MSNPNISHFKLWEKYKKTTDEEKKEEFEKELVNKYYPLVEKLSYKLAYKLNWKVSPEELSSLGVEGLYISVRKFELERGIKFESYSSIRIYGSMIDGLRREDIVPRTVRINNNKYEEIKNILQSKQGVKILRNEILEEMGITEENYLKNTKKYSPITFTSIDNISVSNRNNERDYLHQDQNVNLIDKSINSPDSQLKRKEFFNKLLGKDFSKTEQKIIYMYYYENFTMGKIAKRLDMSESRISQLHQILIKRLRDKIYRNPEYFSSDIYEFISNGNNGEILFK